MALALRTHDNPRQDSYLSPEARSHPSGSTSAFCTFHSFISESLLPILRKLIVSLIFTYSGRPAVLATKVSSAWQDFLKSFTA